MLSEREQQILVLVAQGMSNKQIALQLGISDNTVKVHLRNIFSKINVASRTEASLYAVRHGLLEVAPSSVVAPPPVVPRRLWRWWWVGAVVIVLLGVLGYWYTTAAVVPTQAATPTRWRQLSPLPVAVADVQLVSYRGALLAVAGQEWWRLVGVDARWQALASLPCRMVQGRVWADGAGVWLVGCGDDGAAVWFWDGQTWQARAAWPSRASIVTLTRVDGVLWVFAGTEVWQQPAQADTWRRVADPPRGMQRMQVAVVDGSIYIFDDESRVWRVDAQTAAWQQVQVLPFRAHTIATSTVLGSVLLADATAATLWAFTPSQGIVSAQMVPPTVQLGTQAVQWQSYVVFPSADGRVMPAYQAVFQTFVPVVPEP